MVTSRTVENGERQKPIRKEGVQKLYMRAPLSFQFKNQLLKNGILSMEYKYDEITKCIQQTAVIMNLCFLCIHLIDGIVKASVL